MSHETIIAGPTHEQCREPHMPARAQEYEPTFSLERIVKEARRAMGEARWAQLEKEWDDE